MEEVLYYNSNILDPSDQDELKDQVDIQENYYLQYRCDTISETIGTQECKKNINLFLDEIEIELDEEALSHFYSVVFTKLIDTYHLYILEDHRDMKKVMNYSLETKRLLLFFEKDYADFIVKVLEGIPETDLLFDPTKLLIKLKSTFTLIEKRIKNIKEDLEGLPLYVFTLAPRDDMCYAIARMVTKDTVRLMNRLIMIRGG